MELFDSHCHFDTADDAEIAAQLARARAAGVTRLAAIGGTPDLNASARRAVALARADSDRLPQVVCALGYEFDAVDAPRAPVAAPRAAVGEIGLDYHYYPETRPRQRDLFAAQLREARAANLPVVVHTREAADDTAALLRETPVRGVIHCFTGTPEEARAYLDLGFSISISGIVTFKRAENVRETARMIPADRLLVETDAPFLAPVPLRGKPNEPAFLVHTCVFLAALRGVAPDLLAAQTTANAAALFGMKMI